MTEETSINIDVVEIRNRHRREYGDIDALAASIDDLGLINPITVTSDFHLLAGERRIRAFRKLGRATIPCRIVSNLTEAAERLRAELDENTCRQNMTPSELASLGEALYEVQARESKERQRQSGGGNGRAGGDRRNGSRPGALTVPSDQDGSPEERKTATKVAKALGISSRNYERLKFAHTVANDPGRSEEERVLGRAALGAMDAGKGIQSTENELRRRLRAKEEAQQAKAAALADPGPQEQDAPPADTESVDWIPQQRDNTQKAAARRRELIRELAGKGWSSDQIGHHLNVLESTVRRIAREVGVTIPADEVMGRAHNIDSNRIVRETVAMFDGLEIAIGLIDYDDLDRSEIEHWTVSLSESTRVLNRLNKRLRELVQ